MTPSHACTAPGPGWVHASPDPAAPASRTWVALAVLAVLACLPYLALKLAWLTGSHVGVAGSMDDPAMTVANALTGGMEVAAAVLAVALVRPWGRRLPAPLVVVPMYVGSGLLGGLLAAILARLVTTVATAVRAAVDGSLDGPAGGAAADAATSAQPGEVMIEPWVYTMVYVCFTLLAVTLLGGFLLYARDRWGARQGWSRHLGGAAASARPPAVVPGATRTGALAALAATGVVVAALLAAGLADRHWLPNDALDASLALVGAAGVAMLLCRRPIRRPASIALAAAWFGGAATAAWGLYGAVILAVPNPLTGPDAFNAARIGIHLARAVVGVALTVAAWRLNAAQDTNRLEAAPDSGTMGA